MEDVKIKELPEKSSIETSDHLVVEDNDGTKKVLMKHFRSLLTSSLYFNSVEELKTSSSIALKEGDICETLGYYKPGDGGAAKYKITYNPAAIGDNKLIHYLAYSDTLRAEIILDDFINVHQFGAVGDGVTDDTDAIQAAIDNSESRVIEFSNNKKYAIKDAIKVNKTNTVINGNGATLYPNYSDGIVISPDTNDDDIVSDITINKLHVDCSKSTNGIYVYRANKIDMISCKMDNISNIGINIKNSQFINLSFCELNGQNTGSLIVLDGDNSVTDIQYSRFINILDCDFNNFTKAINVLSTGSTGEVNTTVNIDKCNYYSNVGECYCIYVACPVDMISIYANTVTNTGTFLYFGGAGKGDISCRGISCLNASTMFDIGTTQGVLHLDGSIKVSANTVLFKNMNGKLRTTISWDLLPNGSSFTNKPTGEVYDSIHPYNYADNRGYSVSGTKLTLREVRNLNIDWSSSTDNINEIENGVKGQLIYLKSTTNKNILSVANKIILSDSSIKLGAYKGILMRYDGLKWVQIQYKDSTILQSISHELEVDYSKIAFDTSIIIPAETSAEQKGDI